MSKVTDNYYRVQNKEKSIDISHNLNNDYYLLYIKDKYSIEEIKIHKKTFKSLLKEMINIEQFINE